MNNLYRKLTNKGYTVQQVDEILWRMAHRLALRYEDLEELVEYFNEYVTWDMQQDQTKEDLKKYNINF